MEDQSKDQANVPEEIKEDPKRLRAKNCFDVTNMTYAEYVEKHYEIVLQKHREAIQMQMQQMQMQQMQMQFGGGGGAAAGYVQR